jgi:predicted TIM-barrel fold metal-dependent hydrolase
VEILDAQVHVWEADRPGRPWYRQPPIATAEPAPFFAGETVVTGADMVKLMDAAGVDGALLVTTGRHYGFDNSYAQEVAAHYPDRFRVVARIDPAAPAIEELAADPLVVGVRVLAMAPADRAVFESGGFDDAFAQAQAVGMPVAIYPVGTLPLVGDVARRYPELQLVVDHLGLVQRPVLPRGVDAFADLPQLLELAALPNVAVKLSGVATLSFEPFPFRDVWPHVHRVLEAFGPERVLWGSDGTRAEGIVTYAEGLRWLTEAGELSPDELERVLATTLRRIFNWPGDGPDDGKGG